jgi:WD40 repeat protein
MFGHGDWIAELRPITVGHRRLLASASGDRTVGLWDPPTGKLVACIPVHHPALSCAAFDSTLMIGTTAGPLAIELMDDLLK